MLTSRVLLQIHGFVEGASRQANKPISLFLLQMIIILGMCRGIALIGIHFKQPRVVYEKVGGMLLGPSVLCRNAKFANDIFPPHSWTFIQTVSAIGLQMYMLLVGMSVNFKLIKSTRRRAISIAFISILTPFLLSVVFSDIIYAALQEDSPTKRDKIENFGLFLGISVSITAFPFLAKLLRDTGLVETKVGATAMSAAALNDAMAWVMLTLSLAVANSSSGLTTLYVLSTLGVYLLFILPLVRLLLHWFVAVMEGRYHSASADRSIFGLVLMLTLLNSWVVSMMGLNSLLGAVTFGLVVPRKSRVHASCQAHMSEFISTHFMPLYFGLSGLRADVSVISVHDLPYVALLAAIAILGKLLGAGIPAYIFGFKLREAAAIAVLMNTRGLLELIILNIGEVSGIINQKVYTAMLLVCMFTSFIAFPLVQLLYPEHFRQQQILRAVSEKARRRRASASTDGGNDGNGGIGSAVEDAAEGASVYGDIEMTELTAIHSDKKGGLKLSDNLESGGACEGYVGYAAEGDEEKDRERAEWEETKSDCDTEDV